MMLMSMFAAIFHTVIIEGLWGIKLKPQWFFFVFNPTLIGLSAQYETKLGVLVFIIIFLSVFIFGILGIIIDSIRSGYKSVKREDLYRKKNGMKPMPMWKKIIGTLSTIVFFVFIISLGLPYFILIVFIILPFIISIFSKNNTKSFYKLQKTLPTSSIRSLAMGLAEIKGNTKTIEPMPSKINNKECIGYLYTIESISTDNEGKDSYSLIFSETICNAFFVEDKTGKIKIAPKEIEFIDFRIDEQYQSSMKRYTQYLLKDNMFVLLIGKANVGEKNEPVFQKEEIKNVFGIAPVSSVDSYNDSRPLIKSASYFMYFWSLLIALILLSKIKIKDNSFDIGNIKWELPFAKTKKINSVMDFYDQIYDSYETMEDDKILEIEETINTKPDFNSENEVQDSIREE